MTHDELCRRATTIPGFPVVSAAELAAVGASPDAVQAALVLRWQSPARGVYVAHREPLSSHELALVAVKRAGPGAVLTGVMAARHLGMRWVPDVPGAMVLIGAGVRRRDVEDLVLVRRTQDYAALVTTRWDGVPVAPAPRVVVDAARQVLAYRRRQWVGTPTARQQAAFRERCLRDVRGLVLGAVADALCTAEELLVVVGAGSVRHSALLRQACGDALRGAASPPEAELVDGLLPHGVPFYCNVELWVGEVLMAVADVWIAGAGVGGELDSKERHEAPELLDATLERHRRVEARGATLVHRTPSRYRADPEGFHRELLDEAARRRAAGLGDPPGVVLKPRGPLLGVTPVSPVVRVASAA